MPPKQKKYEKGILGVRKDPRKQILFSLGPRIGDEYPSDDSDDSDYDPTEYSNSTKRTLEQSQPEKRLKRTHPTTSTSADKASLSDPTHNRSAPSNIIAKYWRKGLPWHILQKIFQCVVDDEGCLPFLCRVARVCRLWRDVAYSATLWQDVDLSYGWIKSTEATLKYLCENRFSRLQTINLGTWKNLNNSGLELLSTSCPDLEYIGLPHCTKFNSEGLRHVIDNCTKLKGLDLSNCSMDAVSSSVLKHLVERRGSQLTKLNFSKNTMRGFQAVFNMICTQCPNLSELRLNKVEFSGTLLSINIEKFQANCPLLRVLELSLTSYRASSATQAVKAASPGFPNLEEVSLAIDTSAYTTVGLDDDFLSRLLKNSTKLRLVDLRGSSSIKCQTLQGLPATDIQHLYISLSSVAKYAGIEIIMSKWQHSLRDLDLSWNLYPGMSLDCAIHKLSSKPAHSALEILNLAGTAISCGRVKSLLGGCPKLQTLNLCSCRGLPRGMKSEFRGSAIEQLSRDIERFLEEERGAVNG